MTVWIFFCFQLLPLMKLGWDFLRVLRLITTVPDVPGDAVNKEPKAKTRKCYSGMDPRIVDACIVNARSEE